MAQKQWKFWIDRGGTFTDIIAESPMGQICTYKLLSENQSQYSDATIAGIRHILQLKPGAKLPKKAIHSIYLGTTLATNCLLEKKGEPTVLAITKGFADSLQIGYQNRPDIFARHIILPPLIYEHVIEINERIAADGQVLDPINIVSLKESLQSAFDQGYRAIAIVLMHCYRNNAHELIVEKYARLIGFKQICVSHKASPLIKLINRGDTTVADAYISPVLFHYGQSLRQVFGDVPIFFMQSNGGLISLEKMQGKNCILSGPAAGVIGAIASASHTDYKKIISFDMGGTSTDVAHYSGQLERGAITIVAGKRIQAPMLEVHTIAAGGGSIVHFDQSRYQVGPASAGASPGPACYRHGGPLTLTDCNLILGRIQKDYYPKVFGKKGNQSLSLQVTKKGFQELATRIRQETGKLPVIENIAQGFIKIAVVKMANAIKKITIQRGYDVTQYALCSFGGAGGQHACAVADELGIATILIHPFASLLSAYGLSVANLRILKEKAIEEPFNKRSLVELKKDFRDLEQEADLEFDVRSIPNIKKEIVCSARLRYRGSEISLNIPYTNYEQMCEQFECEYSQQFGFILNRKDITIESILVELIGHLANLPKNKKLHTVARQGIKPKNFCEIYFEHKYITTPLYEKNALQIGDIITGPAIIVESINTIIIDPGWQVVLTDEYILKLTRIKSLRPPKSSDTHRDPILLELFYNLFMNTAEQMGIVLAKTAYSVNIKERLDFSCAIFDSQGDLIANAQHIPVHLGSMQASIKAIMSTYRGKIKAGDAYVLNNPYQGGTHLPDITVVTPVFYKSLKTPVFFVAARAHHADVGGVMPGSIPAQSHTIDEEGVLINHFKLSDQGHFLEDAFSKILTSAKYPVRNLHQNLSDIKAQIAANIKGVQELIRIIDRYGLKITKAYTKYIQENAESCVRNIIKKLQSGYFKYEMDNGNIVAVKIKIDKKAQTVIIDFTDSSRQQLNNFNAPIAVCQAAVLYVFRTLITENIPLNQGCFKPLKIIIPSDSLLNPSYPAAVVAGNVETSQCIVDTLYGALKIMAASQGTMNNLTFGNAKYQYYETICGGSGAGPDFDGTSAVHTHMTNTLMTDPEILEQRFPVRLVEFSIREDSGGKGRWRGGDGVIRKIEFLEEMTVSLITNHRVISPYGMAGGESGQCGKNWLLKKNGIVENLPSVVQVNVEAGDILVLATPGGGGYGEQE
jgi:5-oxoprolinase (ATP-hydrolysing)